MIHNIHRGASAAGIIITIIIILVLIGGVWWVFSQIPEKSQDTVSDSATRQEYRNEEYGFVVQYPSDWNVAAFPPGTEGPEPKFNIYPSIVTEEPPFTHHSGVTQVSIFPEGIATEGVFGETRSVSQQIEGADVREFVLDDGTPWAVMVTDFPDAPAPWETWGFLWASAEIQDVTIECMEGEVSVSVENCSPPATGTLVRRGTVDEDTWNTIEAILDSFEFFEPTEQVARAHYTNASEDLIVVENPGPGTTITSPLTVTGQARGAWYFEATFPLVLTDWDGRIIAEGYAEAQSDWMTEGFVPFEGTLTFTPDTGVSNRGTVILQKANASGLPEHDAAVELPVEFE